MSDLTGGSSTFSSSALHANAPFSLFDEKSVVTLLRSIHQSTLTPEEKNALRDLVFSFRSTTGAHITTELQAAFSDLGFPLTAEATAIPNQLPDAKLETPVGAPPVMSRLGATRLAPKFGASPVTAHAVASIVPPPVEVLAVEVPAPEELVVEQEAAVIAVPQSTPLTHVETPITNPSERIVEIKKQVNAMVGNPVNLIDVNNEVGREYMNALLDAMKKSNGGGADEVSQAMARLEKAFVLVQVTMSENTADKTAVEEGEKSTPVQEEVHIQNSEASEVALPADDVPTDLEQEPVATPVESQSLHSFASVHESHVSTQGVTKQNEAVGGYAQMAAEEASPVSREEEPVHTEPATEPVKMQVPAAGGIMSVAKEKQLQDLLISQKQQAATTDAQREENAIAAMDPLMVPAVTNGLQQLLSEWSLFKSSGIFGTGPSGAEHPLYKKLSALTMSAVMAGRFEGATPQIKRSISDYMNGWRYEEGVLHEHTEMFEHYLRRVIKHILEKQK